MSYGKLDDVGRDSNGDLPSFAWPGGHQILYMFENGDVLCPDCANKADRKIRDGAALAGTVSHGTLLTADLLKSFFETLANLNPTRAGELRDDYNCALHTIEAGDTNAEEWDVEEAEWFLNETLTDALNDCAPEGYHFGAHEGDGSDFGFWVSDEWVEENIPSMWFIHYEGSVNECVECGKKFMSEYGDPECNCKVCTHWSSERLPCPECNGTARVQRTSITGGYSYSLQCNKCWGDGREGTVGTCHYFKHEFKLDYPMTIHDERFAELDCRFFERSED